MRRLNSRGFTFIELLVALALTGILMTGLSQIFKSTVSSLYQTGDNLGAQRRNRSAIALMEDDLRMMGYTEGMEAPPVLGVSSFQILPSGGTTVTEDGETSTLYRDEISFFVNMPLDECTLAANIAEGDSEFTVRAKGGNLPHLKRGDYFHIRDGGRSDWGFVGQDTTTGTIQVMSEQDAQTLKATQVGGMGIGVGVLSRHDAIQGPPNEVKVLFIRPMQMIRYSIRMLAKDPNTDSNMATSSETDSDGVKLVPCLVRQQQPYVNGFQWDNSQYQLVATDVQSMRIDLSLDGGETWGRGFESAATWDTIKTNVSAQLPAALKINGANADRLFWFKNVPVLLRLELTTQTAMRRTEHVQAAGQIDVNQPQIDFNHRTQVLMIAPRNCGLPFE